MEKSKGLKFVYSQKARALAFLIVLNFMFTKSYAQRASPSDVYGYEGAGFGNLTGILILVIFTSLIFGFFKYRDLRKYIFVISVALVIIYKLINSAIESNDSSSLLMLAMVGFVAWFGFIVLRGMYDSEVEKTKNISSSVNDMQSESSVISPAEEKPSFTYSDDDFYKYNDLNNLPSGTSLGIKLLHNRAINGDASCQFKIGMAYENGVDLEDNCVKAAKWYQKASDNGHSEAKYRLALLYKNGLGVHRDLFKARDLMNSALKDGFDIPAFESAFMKESRMTDYHTTEEPSVDTNNENSNYSSNLNRSFSNDHNLSPETNDPDFFYNQGVRNELGRGTPIDYVKAANLYQKAAEMGHKKAQFNLSLFYRKGLGVDMDLIEADRWLKLSNDN